MNLDRIVEYQKKFDTVVTKNKGLEEMDQRDLRTKRLFAIQVELMECANEHREFKFWSERQSPDKKSMLEEFIDALAFTISYGLYIQYPFSQFRLIKIGGEATITRTFMSLVADVETFYFTGSKELEHAVYPRFLSALLALGAQLGFSECQIEEAYFEKNKVNHERQESGY